MQVNNYVMKVYIDKSAVGEAEGSTNTMIRAPNDKYILQFTELICYSKMYVVELRINKI